MYPTASANPDQPAYAKDPAQLPALLAQLVADLADPAITYLLGATITSALIMSSQSPYILPLQAMLRKVFQRDQLSEAEWQVVEADLFRRAGTSYEQLAEKIEQGIHSGYD